MAETGYTWCRNCNAACGLQIEVEDNRIVALGGDREDPLSQGYFCIKGQSSMALHNGEDRLVTARKGRGPAQAEIGMEQALDDVAARLTAIVDRHGPGAVALYYGTGANYNGLCHSAFKGFMHLLGSPYLFSSMTLDQSAKWVAIARMGYYTAGPLWAHEVDVAMLVGMNPLVAHYSARVLPIHNPRRWMRQAKASGTKIIVVDPRLTETAKFADLHLPIRPGEDVTLFAALINIVLTRGWENREFCARFVEPLDALREAVSPFTLEFAAARTQLPQADIEKAAEMFACARRAAAATGTGPDMGPHSNLAEHLIQVLNVICGGYRRAGDPAPNPGLVVGPNVAREGVVGPNRTWEEGPKLRTHDLGPLFGEYPTALLPDEIVGRGEDKIRALIVVGGNPIMALADPVKTGAAFDSLEFMVTLDCRTTETTAISDYVLPVSLPYERFDATAMFDAYNPVPFARAAAPLVERPPGVLEDWEIFWGLASRMGRPLEIKRPMFGATHPNIPGPALSLSSDQKPATEDIIRWLTSTFGQTSFDELMAHPHGLMREDLASTVQPAGDDDGVRLNPMAADVWAELDAARLKPPESDYKYRLTVRRLLETLNSAFRNATVTRRRYPVNPAFMNPLDMAEEGIAPEGAMTIRSKHGEVVAYALPDPSVGRGVISMSHLWGSPDAADDPEGLKGAFTGRLVSLRSELETINYMPRQSAIPVNVQART